MERTKTIKDLLDAAALSDGDFLPVSQPGAYNPITQQNGDTRKVTIERLTSHISADVSAASLASQVEDCGRDLMKVLLGIDFAALTTQAQRNDAIARTVKELLRWYANPRGTPVSRWPAIGDYLDGMDFSGIAAPANGTAPQVWSNTYKNNRIVLSGFNHYKGAGYPENTKNHILFTFRNCIAQGRMNATDTNSGGYGASELRLWFEEKFMPGLKKALGGDYLYPVNRLLSTKGNWAWFTDTVFLPTEREVWGSLSWGEAEFDGGTPGQYPIYFYTAYKGKRFNGSRQWWWKASPGAGAASHFCVVSTEVNAVILEASTVGGISPAFCIA